MLNSLLTVVSVSKVFVEFSAMGNVEVLSVMGVGMFGSDKTPEANVWFSVMSDVFLDSVISMVDVGVSVTSNVDVSSLMVAIVDG